MNEFKILMHKFMHEINWHLYYIPKNNSRNVIHLTEKQLTKLKKSKMKISLNNKTNNSNKNDDENNNLDILFIPEHKSINDALFSKNQKKEKFKISKEDIDCIRKLGIISHSFDDNIAKNLEEKENSQDNKNNEE